MPLRPLHPVVQTLCAGAILCGLATAALAEAPKPVPASPDKPPRVEHDERRKELFEQMRTLRVWRLTEELKLTEQQVAKIFPVLTRFDDRERDLAHERGDLSRKLSAAADAPAPNATEITRLIELLLTNRGKRNQLDDERTKTLRAFLTPVQQARLVLLMPKLDEMIRRRIKEAIERERSGDRPEEKP